MPLVMKQCQPSVCPEVKLLFSETAMKTALTVQSHYIFPCNMEIITKQCF